MQAAEKCGILLKRINCGKISEIIYVLQGSFSCHPQ